MRVGRTISLDRGALRVSAVYALVAAAWIYSSDALLSLLIADPARLRVLSTYKGWAFVLVTSALLYALVRGLHAAGSAGEAAPAAAGVAPSPAPPLAVFLTIVGLIAVTGLYVYRDTRATLRNDARAELSAVADLKVRQISAWLAERQGNATRAGHDPFMVPAFEAWLKAGAPPGETERRLRSRLEGLRAAYGWSEVTLLDGAANVRLALGREHALPPRLLAVAGEAMRTRSLRFVDLHRVVEDEGQAELGYVAPLLTEEAGPRAVGAVLLELDAERFLQPLMRLWPLPTRSGETLLARVEGPELVFLSALLHRPVAPLALRLPLSSGLPAARALREGPGSFESEDYRGVPVLAAVRAVPETGWLLEAKVDRAEAEAPLELRARLLASLGLILVATAGLAVVLWWRQQRAHAQLQALRAEQEREALARHYDDLSRYANDAIVLMDEAGRILEVNERALAFYGWDREELIGLDARELREPGQAGTFDEHWRVARERGGVVFETVHRRRDGSTFPVEVSSRAIDVEGRSFHQAIVRDVTERHAAQERIRRLTQLYAALSQMNQAIARGLDRDGLFSELCRVAVVHGGFKFAWVGLVEAATGRVEMVARHGRDEGYLDGLEVWADPSRLGGLGPTGTAIHEGRPYVCDNFLGDPRTLPWRERALQAGVRASAALPLSLHGQVIGALNVYSDQAGVFRSPDPGGGDRDVLGLLEDMTADVAHALDALDQEQQRRAAEQALRESEEKYRLLFDNERDALALLDLESRRFLDANAAFFALLGYDREELPGLGPDSITDEPSGTAASLAALRERGFARVPARRLRRKDGRRLWVELRLSAFDWQGRKVVSAILRDITDERQAEERRLLWSRVLEDSAEAIVIADAAGRILTVNKAFTEMSGWSPEETLGTEPVGLLDLEQHEKGFYPALLASVARTGRWQGEVWNRRKDGESYPAWLSITAVHDGQGALTHYVGIASDITERKEAAQRIHFLAHHDFLTGLPTRTLASDFALQAVAQAQRRGRSLALLCLDLDRFKSINDSLGHHAGDQLLQRVAERLVACLPSGHTVARLGGDQFLVLLPDLARGEDAGPAAEQVLRAVRAPLTIEERELTVTASVGISVFPHDGSEVPQLLKNAEAAMYHAKEVGRNNFQFFTPDLNVRAFEALSMEMSLKMALERDEFLLLYQPQFEAVGGRLVGVEALLRWRHRDLGLVSPARFVPLAEEHGLILPIGDWVLRTACSQVRRWLDEGLPAVPVAVNMSALQFRRPGLAARLQEILAETGLPARYLELELTESIVMHRAESTIALLAELQQMGLSLSIDDFGTGYSSLSYLRRFHIHKLKIDQSFVRDLPRDPDAAAITAAIVGMGKSLKLRIIAEGVETDEQLELLRRLGCDEVQGYLTGAPVAAGEIAARLRAGPA